MSTICTVSTLSLLITSPLPGEITGDVAVVVVLLFLQAVADNIRVKTINAAAVKNTFSLIPHFDFV